VLNSRIFDRLKCRLRFSFRYNSNNYVSVPVILSVNSVDKSVQTN